MAGGGPGPGRRDSSTIGSQLNHQAVGGNNSSPALNTTTPSPTSHHPAASNSLNAAGVNISAASSPLSVGGQTPVLSGGSGGLGAPGSGGLGAPGGGLPTPTYHSTVKQEIVNRPPNLNCLHFFCMCRLFFVCDR